MPNGAVPLKLAPQRGFLQTMRKDTWWVQSLLTLLVFTAFLVWAHFRVFENNHYYSAHGGGANLHTNYLTPFYSPLFFDVPKTNTAGQPFPSGHALLAEKPAFLPGFVSAAALILIFPAGFRFTCYYYRGAYYKAFWGDPPSCAVGEPRKRYLGERYLPLVLQNVHRYFFYAAAIFVLILGWDALMAFRFYVVDPGTGLRTGQTRLGVGVGSLLMVANTVLLALYTFGCHSLRHLIGGGRDALSANPASHKAYNCVTCLNNRHPLWAWCSLFSVGLTDVYIWMLARGAWTDLHVMF